MIKTKIRTFSLIHERSMQLLGIGSLMIFFWGIFDAIVSYLSPILIANAGFSKTSLGLILGSSSIAGAIFDFLLSKYLKNPHYRRLYFMMFAVCFIVPLVLLTSKTLVLFLIIMALWGLYFDLQNFGEYDLMSRISPEAYRSTYFGIENVFHQLAYIIGPILIGFLIVKTVDIRPFLLLWITIIIAFFFYILLSVRRTDNLGIQYPDKPVLIKRIHEASLWKSIGFAMFPVLIFICLYNIYDAFFWTIGPLLSQTFGSFKELNGLFLAAYTFPPLLTGWLVGYISRKRGKKRTAYIAFGIGSGIICLFGFVHNPLILLGIILLASFFTTFSLPAMSSAFIDYIAEARDREKEIEGLCDFATNAGYVIGPIFAGFVADRIGNTMAFSILGVVGIVITILLMKFTPKSITIPSIQEV